MRAPSRAVLETQQHQTPQTAGVPMDVAFFMPEGNFAKAGREMRQTASSTSPTMVRLLLLQFGLGMAVAVVFLMTSGYIPGYSAALGGLASVVPNAFLALRLALPRDDAQSRPLMRAAFTGELGKIALMIIIFVVILTQVRPLAYGALFTGFVAAQIAIVFGVFLPTGDGKNEESRESE